MDDDGDSPPEPHADPEVEALLRFEPVVRKCVRHDGWLPAKQREFIVALTVLGHAQQAAIAVGGTMSGVYKLRTAEGGEGFAAAWDSALALHHRRHPRPEAKGRPSRGEIEAGTGRTPWPAAPATPPEGWVDPRIFFLSPAEFVDGILKKYWLKLGQERKARLEGRIVEADFYVRQLSWMEVCIDLGGNSHELLHELKRGGLEAMDIVATPMSSLLDDIRREYWRVWDEPERPPRSPFGCHDDEVASGPPTHYSHERDGDEKAFRRRRSEDAAVAAEAQRLWEEKARADSAAWRERVGGEDARGQFAGKLSPREAQP